MYFIDSDFRVDFVLFNYRFIFIDNSYFRGDFVLFLFTYLFDNLFLFV